MTPAQADRLIERGQPVIVRSAGEVFTRTFVRRDRWNIYTAPMGAPVYLGGKWAARAEKYDRGDLEIVKT